MRLVIRKSIPIRSLAVRQSLSFNDRTLEEF